MSHEDEISNVNPEVHDPAEDYEVEGGVSESHDDTDVPAALENNETDDGKGGAVVPKADFESYADSSADEGTEQN